MGTFRLDGDPMTGPRISSLLTYCTIVEVGSFSRAAQRLGITQSAVSQQIKRLEKDYGTRLLHRNGTTVIPTEDGKIFYEYATRIVNLFQRSRQAIREAANEELTGSLMIGASTGLGEYFLPTALARFKAEHPGVHLAMHVGDSDEILDRVLQHRLEIGVVGTTRRDQHLNFDLFAHDRLVLVVSPTHDISKHRSLTLDQLKGVPLILQQPGSGATSALSSVLGSQGVRLEDLNVIMEAGLQESTKAAVRSGLGATVISRFGVAEELRDETLVEIEVENLELAHDFHVAHHRDWPLSRLAHAYLQQARKLVMGDT